MGAGRRPASPRSGVAGSKEQEQAPEKHHLSPAPTLVDNPNAPEIFADEVAGYLSVNGAMRLTLAVARAHHDADPAPVARYVAARLVLPLSTVESLHRMLAEFLRRQAHTLAGDDQKMQ